LGTIDLANPPVPAVYYYLVYNNGTEKLVGAGLVQTPRTLSCQALGIKVTYSGPPK